MPHRVFLSYNSKDEDFVKQIGYGLKELALEVWFDTWDLQAGQSWISALGSAIRGSTCSAIFIGEHGLGPWQRKEVDLVVSRAVKQPFTVVPVMLPDAKRPKIPDFLSLGQCIDCRSASIHRNPRVVVAGLVEAIARAITQRDLLRSIPQIGEEFTLTLGRRGGGNRVLTLYTFPNPDPGHLLNLTWATFGQGISNLHSQIKSYGYHPNVDACLGINDAGLVMATFLNSSLFSRVKIGYVRCQGAIDDAVVLRDSFFPQLGPNPTLLITDFEVKVANVLGYVMEAVRERYSNPKVYFAVFGAMTSKPDLKIARFEELVSAKNLTALKLEDIFIAGTMHHPGIEPPFELR